MTYSNPAAYERFMGRWSALLAPRFIQFAGVRDGQRILDVGCGTGSLSRALLASGRSIRVLGVDPTEDYVTAARQTIPDPRVSFQVSSVETRPFPDGFFAAAMALLVLQDMADPEGAVREMARATRPGGPVAACLWDFQSGMPRLFWQAAEAVAPDTVAHRRAERPPSQLGLQRLAEIWTGAGLAEVTTGSLELTQEFGSFEDFWLPLLDRSTPATEFAIAMNRDHPRSACERALPDHPAGAARWIVGPSSPSVGGRRHRPPSAEASDGSDDASAPRGHRPENTGSMDDSSQNPALANPRQMTGRDLSDARPSSADV